MLDTASPARISVTGPPCAPASATTASMATAAPASPPSGSAKREHLREPQVDGEHRAQRRTARDADQARLGQRIAQVALQRRPRQPERAAHQRTQHGARQADLAEDQRAGLAGGVDAEAGRADREREDEATKPPATPKAASRCIGLTSGRPETPIIAGAPRCRLAPATSRSIASAMCGVPHSQWRQGSSSEAPRWRSSRMTGWRRLSASTVRYSSVLLASTSRSGGLATSDFERHLAAAREPIGGRHVAEAGGGERRIGQAAGARDRAADLVDDGRGRRRRQVPPERDRRRSNSAISASPLPLLADGGGHRAHRSAHAVEVLRQRHDHHVAAEPAQQVDGRRDAERARQHQVGIVAQHVLGAAVGDGDAARLLGNGRDGRVGQQDASRPRCGRAPPARRAAGPCTGRARRCGLVCPHRPQARPRARQVPAPPRR